MKDLDDKAAKVEAVLRTRRGHGAAIKSEELTQRTGIADRELRDIVSYLVEHKKLAIGSHPALGFFWIETREDRDLAGRHLKSRAVKLFRRLSVIEHLTVGELAKQLEFWE